MQVADILKQKLIEALNAVYDRNHDSLDRIAKDGGREAAQGMLGDVHSLVDIITGIVGSIPIIGGILEAPASLLGDVEGAGGKLGTGFGAGYLLGYAGYQLAEPVLRMAQHEIEHIFNSQIFDPQTAATLTAHGIISHAFGASQASGSGFDGDHFSWLAEGSLAYPSLAETLDMLNRKLITAEQAALAIERSGVPEPYRQAITDLRRQLLSPADLALALLRGVITEETATGYADQLGVTPDDLAVLVENTGEPPGLMQLLEAYRRGFIDKATLEHGIRQSRVRDEWIPTVEALRYEPMSVADAARAVVQNYLTEKEGGDIAQQNGLTPDAWPVLVEAYGRPLAHEQMMKLFYLGEASQAQVDQAFRESDLKDKYITLSRELGRKLLTPKEITDAIKYGAISLTEGAYKLMQLGYEQTDVSVLIKLGVAESKGAITHLTRQQIVSAYSDGLLSRAQAESDLAQLGYTTADDDLILKVADYSRKHAALRTAEASLKASVQDGRVTDPQAIDQLVQAGADHATAVQLVASWHHAHGKPVRQLSEAQVLKAARSDTITATDALSRLEALGFDAASAKVLLASEGVKVP